MTSRTAHDDLKAPAAQGLGHYGVGSGTIKHDGLKNEIRVMSMAEDVPHAAQVAFAFFADVPDKKNGHRVAQAHGAQHPSDCQHRDQARTVVRNSRSI